MADFKPTHTALRPIKRHDKIYVTGSLLELDDEEASNLGITAIARYVIPVEAMTAAQLSDAAKDARAKEKAAKDAAEVVVVAANAGAAS